MRRSDREYIVGRAPFFIEPFQTRGWRSDMANPDSSQMVLMHAPDLVTTNALRIVRVVHIPRKGACLFVEFVQTTFFGTDPKNTLPVLQD